MQNLSLLGASFKNLNFIKAAKTRLVILPNRVTEVFLRAERLCNRPLSHGGHFESQENKKFCFCPSSLALDERLDGQNLLFQHYVIKLNCQELVLFTILKWLYVINCIFLMQESRSLSNRISKLFP